MPKSVFRELEYFSKQDPSQCDFQTVQELLDQVPYFRSGLYPFIKSISELTKGAGFHHRRDRTSRFVESLRKAGTVPFGVDVSKKGSSRSSFTIENYSGVARKIWKSDPELTRFSGSVITQISGEAVSSLPNVDQISNYPRVRQIVYDLKIAIGGNSRLVPDLETLIDPENCPVPIMRYEKSDSAKQSRQYVFLEEHRGVLQQYLENRYTQLLYDSGNS